MALRFFILIPLLTVFTSLASAQWDFDRFLIKDSAVNPRPKTSSTDRIPFVDRKSASAESDLQEPTSTEGGNSISRPSHPNQKSSQKLSASLADGETGIHPSGPSDFKGEDAQVELFSKLGTLSFTSLALKNGEVERVGNRIVQLQVRVSPKQGHFIDLSYQMNLPSSFATAGSGYFLKEALWDRQNFSYLTRSSFAAEKVLLGGFVSLESIRTEVSPSASHSQLQLGGLFRWLIYKKNENENFLQLAVAPISQNRNIQEWGLGAEIGWGFKKQSSQGFHWVMDWSYGINEWKKAEVFWTNQKFSGMIGLAFSAF